ncbi:hypothetical protein [Streptomyces sp. CT34]|uniref:hypothetical protein n=1 Tax=Streptomyces sp. CT34 TaxID=1553907 RepID=UPI0005B8AFBD|nr:hypothetical protein [Streptomyces sp. CT34]
MTTQLVRVQPEFQVAKFEEKAQVSTTDLVIESEVRFDRSIARNANDEYIVEVSLKGFNLEFRNNNDTPKEYSLGREEVRVEVVSVNGRKVKVKLVAKLRPRDAGPGFHFRASGQALVWALTTV